MRGRGNGLEASSYTPLTDLEPNLADAMLEVLRDEGVAAYVVPASQHSSGLTMTDFKGPLERLWVDASAKSRAQDVLEARLPLLRAELEHQAVRPDPVAPVAESGPDADGPGGAEGPRPSGDTATAEEQAAWAAIVASFNDTPSDPVPRWPVLEDIEDRRRSGRPGTETGAETAERPGDADLGEGAGRDADRDDALAGLADLDDLDGDGERPERRGRRAGDAATAADDEAGRTAAARDDEDHFVPPTPPPLPRTDTVTKVAWAALLGGPVYLFVATLLHMDVSGWNAIMAAGAFVGGFVTLVARMGDRPPTDSGPDDGAVV